MRTQARLGVLGALALAVPLAVGCAAADSTASAGETEPGARPASKAEVPTPEVESPGTPVVDSPETFADALARLDAEVDASDDATATLEAIDDALAAFDAHYGDPGDRDEAALRAGLDALIAFLETRAQAGEAAWLADADLSAAACNATRSCSTDAASPAAEATLADLRGRAIGFVYAGEGTVEAAVLYGALLDRLEPSLTPAARGYLEAEALTQRAAEGYDEGGYYGDPDPLAAAALAWDALAELAPTVHPEARQQALDLLGEYLSVCWSSFDGDCRVTKPIRESYAGFLADHRDSRLHPAVARFHAGAERARFRLSDEAFEALLETSLAAVSEADGRGRSGPE